MSLLHSPRKPIKHHWHLGNKRIIPSPESCFQPTEPSFNCSLFCITQDSLFYYYYSMEHCNTQILYAFPLPSNPHLPPVIPNSTANSSRIKVMDVFFWSHKRATTEIWRVQVCWMNGKCLQCKCIWLFYSIFWQLIVGTCHGLQRNSTFTWLKLFPNSCPPHPSSSQTIIIMQKTGIVLNIPSNPEMIT